MRELGAAAGVVLRPATTPRSNGYKVYGPDGCQVVPALAEAIILKIDELDDPFAVTTAEEEAAIRAGLATAK